MSAEIQFTVYQYVDFQWVITKLPYLPPKTDSVIKGSYGSTNKHWYKFESSLLHASNAKEHFSWFPIPVSEVPKSLRLINLVIN